VPDFEADLPRPQDEYQFDRHARFSDPTFARRLGRGERLARMYTPIRASSRPSTTPGRSRFTDGQLTLDESPFVRKRGVYTPGCAPRPTVHGASGHSLQSWRDCFPCQVGMQLIQTSTCQESAQVPSARGSGHAQPRDPRSRHVPRHACPHAAER
jgi:hypothetical protein